MTLNPQAWTIRGLQARCDYHAPCVQVRRLGDPGPSWVVVKNGDWTDFLALVAKDQFVPDAHGNLVHIAFPEHNPDTHRLGYRPPVLDVSRAEWHTFVAGVKDGTFDLDATATGPP
jgi:hypothetical protein